MCRIKFVIVMLCLVKLVELRPRKLYYPNPNDPSAIVFEGPTNYDTRKSSENEVAPEVDEDILDLLDVRFGEVGAKKQAAEAPPPSPVDTGFFFPDD